MSEHMSHPDLLRDAPLEFDYAHRESYTAVQGRGDDVGDLFLARAARAIAADGCVLYLVTSNDRIGIGSFSIWTDEEQFRTFEERERAIGFRDQLESLILEERAPEVAFRPIRPGYYSSSRLATLRPGRASEIMWVLQGRHKRYPPRKGKQLDLCIALSELCRMDYGFPGCELAIAGPGDDGRAHMVEIWSDQRSLNTANLDPHIDAYHYEMSARLARDSASSLPFYPAASRAPKKTVYSERA